MLIDLSLLQSNNNLQSVHHKIKEALTLSVREVDIRGWYDYAKVAGVIFTELDSSAIQTLDETIISNVYKRLRDNLSAEWISQLDISWHVFPETDKTMSLKYQFDRVLYPDQTKNSLKERFPLAVKSFFDITISAFALILLFPFFFLTAAAVKATSRGPVFFRQKRIGLNGNSFEMLKFRSMYVNCDEDSHKKYID